MWRMAWWRGSSFVSDFGVGVHLMPLANFVVRQKLLKASGVGGTRSLEIAPSRHSLKLLAFSESGFYAHS